MTTNQYERDFENVVGLRFPGRFDPRLLDNVGDVGDGYPGLQKMFRNYLHTGGMAQDINMNTHGIIGLTDPVLDQGASTKKYTDDKISDASYDVTWNGVTSIAASKNAIYDAAFLQNIVEDLSPELGGDLDAQDNRVIDMKIATFDSEKSHGNSGTGVHIDFDNYQKHYVTFNSNCTVTLKPPHNGVGNFLLRCDYGGSYTITWATEGASSIYWFGGATPELGLSGVDIIGFYYDGSDYYGQASIYFNV